ncbi:MAG: STAS domain-containing protein [Phycisphaerales bacterium]|jgi:anti-sigma B factor antagonist|nr:STAS domain-containing protein [Phycisphaerales bacterium]
MELDNAKMQVAVEQGVTMVTLSDQKILDEINIARIGENLYALVRDAAAPMMVVDFATVANMSSSALGMLITLHKRIRETSGKLVLCNIQPAILEVFRITRLDEIFMICASRSEALEQF